MTKDALTLLQTRRSVKAKDLTAPGPDATTLESILKAAIRVPDHGKLAPWRILVLKKEGQKALGEVLENCFVSDFPDANAKQRAFEQERPQRAPLLLVVVFSPKLGKIPLWEQQLSCGALCQNLMLAVEATGFHGQWLTEWPAFDARVKEALGCVEEEEIAGFFYLGTAKETPEERPRPSLDNVVQYWPDER